MHLLQKRRDLVARSTGVRVAEPGDREFSGKFDDVRLGSFFGHCYLHCDGSLPASCARSIHVRIIIEKLSAKHIWRDYPRFFLISFPITAVRGRVAGSTNCRTRLPADDLAVSFVDPRSKSLAANANSQGERMTDPRERSTSLAPSRINQFTAAFALGPASGRRRNSPSYGFPRSSTAPAGRRHPAMGGSGSVLRSAGR